MPTASLSAIDTPLAQPRFITQDESELFVWHHAARPSARRAIAVVLCPPSSNEYVLAYRAWRRLAERLADIGFDVLRFDYQGTGESSGGPDDHVRPEAWVDNIRRVVEEAQTLTGSREVAMVGLRLGAMLALQAAAECGIVQHLVLWSPFRSGRACLRELKALARLTGGPITHNPEKNTTLLTGYLPPDPVASALEQVDLDTLPGAPAAAVLLVERDDRPSDQMIAERLERSGARVTSVQPPGTAKMLEYSASPATPHDVLEAITRWLGEHRPASCPVARGPRPDTTHEAMAHARGYIEHAIRFGPGGRLFGMLSVPRDSDAAPPAIIFLNTGSEYRVGPHRLYVPLARHWAARGHVVFRYDLGGVGDSGAPPGAADNVPYPAHALDDAREAVALVRQRAPGRRIIMAGLCSGGWHSFLAARDRLPVDAVVSVNAPLYLYTGDSKPSAEAWVEHQHAKNYRNAWREPARWRRALLGRSCYRSFLRHAAIHVARKAAHGLHSVFGLAPPGLGRDLLGISKRGVTSLFIFGRGERGLEYFFPHAHAALRRRHAQQHIRYEVVDGADHTFSSPSAQQSLQRILIDFVASQTTRPAISACEAAGNATPAWNRLPRLREERATSK